MTIDDSGVRHAIDEVASVFGLTVDKTLLREYVDGKCPDLLTYEKLMVADRSIPALQQFLIGAESYLAWPKQYYDIYRACRPVLLVQRLAKNIAVLQGRAGKFEKRFKALRKAQDFDSFDSVLFELLAAAAYAKHPKASSVAFVNASGLSKSPDIEMLYDRKQTHVECKHLNRSSDASIELRNHVRTIFQAVFREFYAARESYVFDVRFSVEPRDLTSDDATEALLTASKSPGSWVVERGISVLCKPLAKLVLKDYVLFPSAQYYQNRYGFRHHEWIGLVNVMEAKNAVLIENQAKQGRSSWLDEVAWECAVKWTIANPEVGARYRRIGYSRILKGLDQLNEKRSRSILHVAFESERALGPRRDELLGLYEKLVAGGRDQFSWLVLNEKLFDVSYEGVFDLVEHAHSISGPTRFGDRPPVSCLYSDDLGLPVSEFGVGHQLPDIDDVRTMARKKSGK